MREIKSKKDKDKLQEAAKHNEIAKLLDRAKSKANAGEFYEYVFDEIAEKIRRISSDDDYIDQIAIIIGNKAIEVANREQQGLNLLNRNDAIVRLNNIYETLETRLNLAKQYAKRAKTREWLNNQMPKGNERDTLRNLANRVSGGSTSTSSGSFGDAIAGIGLIIVGIIAIALVVNFPWLLIVIGIIAWIIFSQ